jgi:predicted phosphodiesterase
MSYEEKSLSFGNRWYRPGFEHRELYTLPSGKQIYRLPVAYYMATKIEALLSRGGADWRGAKDFEDIIYVLNYCTDFMARFRASETDVQQYLSEQFATMLQRLNFNEEIECAISADEIERTDMLIQIMCDIALYKPEPGLRIQFVSDLHLEFEQNRLWLEENPLEVTGDILLIAGDTAYLDVPESGRDTYSQYAFWDWASEHYKQVIVCLGNHDFYGYYDLATMPEGYCKQIRHNVHAYYNKVVSLGDVDIIVSTLWSFIEPFDAYQTEKGVSDFYRIMYNGHRLTADDFNAEHERCFDFIRKAVKESKAQTKIVLTHHVPTQQCTAKEFRGSTINGAFTVELGNYIAGSDIDYWIYGHSHRNIDAQIGKTKILSNQLGYISHGEFLRNGFKLGKMIEV